MSQFHFGDLLRFYRIIGDMYDKENSEKRLPFDGEAKGRKSA